MNLPLDPNEDAKLHLVIAPYNYTLQVENLVSLLEGWNLLLLCKNRVFPSDQDPGLVTRADVGVGIASTHIFPHLCRWVIEITYLPVFHLIWAIPLVITLVEHWNEHQSFYDTVLRAGPESKQWNTAQCWARIIVVLPFQCLMRSYISIY